MDKPTKSSSVPTPSSVPSITSNPGGGKNNSNSAVNSIIVATPPLSNSTVSSSTTTTFPPSASSSAGPSSINKGKPSGNSINSSHSHQPHSSSSAKFSSVVHPSQNKSVPTNHRLPHPSQTNPSRASNGGTKGQGGKIRQFRRQDQSGAKDVEEDFRIQAQKALVEFRSSEDETITFPSTLTNTERKYVHYLCNNMGLVSKSSGKGENRQLHVRRKNAKDIESIHHSHVPKHPEILLAPTSTQAITTYLQRYPLTKDDWSTSSLIDEYTQQQSYFSRNDRTGGLNRTTAHEDTDWWHRALQTREKHPEYSTMLTNRKTLPAWRVREDVVTALHKHQIIIVSGDTGCGKSTQIPQFILDSIDFGPSVNMIVTQPRRISAITLAERVASERCEDVGRYVGYNVRLESNVSKDTRLLFVTTGVLLRMLVNDPLLKNITHICIDEVHERDINSDFLLIITRDLLVYRPDIRIVIMSATLQLELFTNFFTRALQDAQRYQRQKYPHQSITYEPVPAVIHVAGSTFPVTRYYLEDILLHTGYANHLISPSSVLNSHLTNGIPTSLPETLARNVTLMSSNAFANSTGPSLSSLLHQQANTTEPSNLTIPSPVLQGKSSSLSSPTEISGLVCALCGKTQFTNVEDFALHAAFCTGEIPAVSEEANTLSSSIPAILPSSSNETIAIPLLESSSTGPSSAVGTAERTPSSSRILPVSPSGAVRTKTGIILPGGAKAKLLDAMQKRSESNTSSDISPSLSSSTDGPNGHGSLISEEIEKLVDTYQKGMDEEEIDIPLLMSLLGHIVEQSLTSIRTMNPRGNTTATSIALPTSNHPLTNSPSFDQHTGGRMPADTGLGAVLVFLPGWEEISQVMELMRVHTLLGNTSKVLILPLHSQVPSSEQRRAFRRPPPGVVKVILSTNIAETSVTIDDVVYVIDAGKVREKSYDPYTGCSRLASVWISQASSRQRAGRAGRVRPGIAYHLFSKRRHQSMNEFSIPEMLRMPLDELCLQIKLLKLGNHSIRNLTVTENEKSTETMNADTSEISQFLARAVQPPPPGTVKAAIELLRSIGALRNHQHTDACHVSSTGCPMNENEDELTLLGKRLANLPMSPRLGKMLLLSILFRCLDPILTITCAMSFRPPWLLPMFPGEKARADKARFSFAHSSRSDHMSLLGAFQSFHEARRRGGNAPFNSVEQQFCRENFISAPALNMITAMRGQLVQELHQAGCFDTVSLDTDGNGSPTTATTNKGSRYFSPGVTDPTLVQYVAASSTNSHNNALVMSTLAAGLYPNIGRNNPSMDMENAHTKLQTRTTRKAIVHFSSINSMIKDPKNRNSTAGALAKASTTNVEWVCFDEMSNIGTRGTIALRGTTVVHPLALLLLSTLGKMTETIRSGKENNQDDTYDSFLPALLNGNGSSSGHTGDISLTELERSVKEQLQKSKAENGNDDEDDDDSDSDEENDDNDEEDDESPAFKNKNNMKETSTRTNAGNSSVPIPTATGTANVSTVKGFKPYLTVDDWISFTLQPTFGILLSLLRNRLSMAFHRLIITPSSVHGRKGGKQSNGKFNSSSSQSNISNTTTENSPFTEMDNSTVDLIIRLLTNEVYGVSAANVPIALINGNKTSIQKTIQPNPIPKVIPTNAKKNGNNKEEKVTKDTSTNLRDDIATIAEITPVGKTSSNPSSTVGIPSGTKPGKANHKPLAVVIPPILPPNVPNSNPSTSTSNNSNSTSTNGKKMKKNTMEKSVTN